MFELKSSTNCKISSVDFFVILSMLNYKNLENNVRSTASGAKINDTANDALLEHFGGIESARNPCGTRIGPISLFFFTS